MTLDILIKYIAGSISYLNSNPTYYGVIFLTLALFLWQKYPDRFDSYFDRFLDQFDRLLDKSTVPLLFLVYFGLTTLFYQETESLVKKGGLLNFSIEISSISFTIGMLGLTAGAVLQRWDSIENETVSEFLASAKFFIYAGITSLLTIFVKPLISQDSQFQGVIVLGHLETILDLIFLMANPLLFPLTAAFFTVGILRLMHVTRSIEPDKLSQATD